MSWHFLQGREAASWEENSLAGAPAALSNLMPTAAPSCSPGSATACSNPSRSGMTLRRSTGGRGPGALTWFRVDSPVRTYLPPAPEQASEGNAADSGPSSPGSLAKFNPASYSWKTAQCSLFGGLMSFSETLPRWGSMRAGELFPLPTPSGLEAHRAWITSASASGLSLPTPSLRASDADKGGHGDLIQAVRGNSNKHFKRMPTVVAVSNTGGRCGLDGGSHARATLTDQEKKELTGGILNPAWVEWLMGWPIGWTDLRPLGMDKFRQWLSSHGRC